MCLNKQICIKLKNKLNQITEKIHKVNVFMQATIENADKQQWIIISTNTSPSMMYSKIKGFGVKITRLVIFY